MIVTRRRRKPFPWRKLLLPAIAIALVIFALLWGPSRDYVSNGPLAPMYRVAGNAWDTIAAPFHFAAQNEVITDRNRQIAALQQQLTDAQNAAADKTKEAQTLQQQIDDLQAQAAASRGNASPNPGGSTVPSRANAAPAPAPSAGFGVAAQAGYVAGDLSQGASADIRRTGNYWSSMEPDNAAKIVQRLPPSYVARVFALMSPNDVGAILDALPPAYAAKLTQENPEIQR